MGSKERMTHYMRHALTLARKNIGQTWPNPAVGAVVVKNDKIIGEGFTARSGRPHAEPQALTAAGKNAEGATMYVSFEPCSHFGKTPPCVDAIINAKIAHVVIACGDPAPHVNGQGIAKLKEAGIEVTTGICEAEARDLNRGFISAVERKRPFVAMKIATSADGKIAGGKERWITGEASRNYVHMLRSQFDAVLTGIETVISDDPMLDCRIAGLEDKSPLRIILDRKNRLSPASKIAKSKDKIATLILNTPTIDATLAVLAEKGITRVLVEAGKKINTAFFKSGKVDQLYWFKSTNEIGTHGLDAIDGGLSVNPAWRLIERTNFPPDSMELYECLPAS